MAVDEVLAGAAQHDLPCNGYLAILLEANRRLLFVTVIETYRYASLRDTCLPSLVDQVLRTVSFAKPYCEQKAHT